METPLCVALDVNQGLKSIVGQVERQTIETWLLKHIIEKPIFSRFRNTEQ